MTIRHKENRVRHRGVVPLFAVPNLVHRSSSISPRGVEYPGRPVDTRQSYFFVPLIETVIFCVVLSMVTRTLGLLAPGVDSGFDSRRAAVEVDPVHTLAPSFHRRPALAQSALVSGWLEVSATNAAVEVDPVHTLAPSFHRMPGLPQSARVSGWLEVSPANTDEDSA